MAEKIDWNEPDPNRVHAIPKKFYNHEFPGPCPCNPRVEVAYENGERLTLVAHNDTLGET